MGVLVVIPKWTDRHIRHETLNATKRVPRIHRSTIARDGWRLPQNDHTSRSLAHAIVACLNDGLAKSCRMGFPMTRLYSIEIKDAETGELVAFAAVDWTPTQEQIAIALISRLARGASGPSIPGEPWPRNAKSRYN